MVKSLFDGMNVSNDCLDEFKDACSELVGTKYILAEKKIGAVLQIIAKSRRLYALIAGCMEGFDFSAELSAAKQLDRNGVPVLVLPGERKTGIAFVFCLLLSFDTGQTDFKRFLHTFYCSLESANAEFSDFASAVIVPFCDDVVNLYIAEAGNAFKNAGLQEPRNKGCDAVVPASSQAVQQPYGAVGGLNSLSASSFGVGQAGLLEPSVFPTDKPPQESQNAQDFGASLRPAPAQCTPGTKSDDGDIAALSMITCAKEVIGIAARDPSMDAREREELLLVCEAFIQAVRFGAEKPIRTMYIALKNTVRCSSIAKKLGTQAGDLERIMNDE